MQLTQLTRGASLLAVLSSIFLCSNVRAYQLTSQYLGTAPSRDNEHLLLFKLPETISSQLLVESNNLNQQQQQQSNHQNTGLYIGQPNNNYNNNNLKPATTSYNNNQYSTYNIQQAPLNAQQYEPNPPVQEQAVSLTIPLLSSALHADDQTAQAQLQPSAGYLARPGPVHSQSQQQTNRHQQALESALAEYLVHANNNNNNNQQADSVASLYSRDNAQSAQQGDALMDQQQNSAAAADLAALGQLQLARQLSLLAGANQPDEPSHPPIQYAQLQLLADNQQQQQQANYSVPSSSQQPRLWRDTQISYAPSPHLASSSTSSAHIQQQNNHSDVSSLVARLANSSPDLLIRLKNLLKKTTSSSSRLVASTQTSSSSRAPLYEHLKLSGPSENLRPLESLRHSVSTSDGAGNDYFMANNVAPRELKQLIQNYLDQTRAQGQSEGGDDSTNSLKALLSNSNVTSHEEIKIPLILIAMPRILSFRKNNTGTIGNSSSLPSISKALAQRLVGQLPHLLEAAAANNNNNLTQQHTPYGSNGTTLTNHLYQSDSGSSRANATTDSGGRQVYWIGQQQQQPAASTTSVPAHVHTMAPYAQQFLNTRLASAPPLTGNGGGRFVPMLTQSHSQPQTASAYQVMQPSVTVRQLPEANQSDVYVAGRKSTGDSGRNQVLSLVSAQGDSAQGGDVGYQVQLIGGGGGGSGSSSNEAGENQQQKQYANSLPFYDVKQTLEHPNDAQQEEQRMIYIAPATGQRRSISPSPIIGRFQLVNSTNNEEHAPTAAAAQLRPPYDPATRLQTSYNDHQRDPLVSKLSLMEEQISRLRPLFQSASKRATPTSDDRTKLSPSQLISLFSRSTARRSWTAPRSAEEEDQQGAVTQRQAANGPGGAKKSPKMVLMFV